MVLGGRVHDLYEQPDWRVQRVSSDCDGLELELDQLRELLVRLEVHALEAEASGRRDEDVLFARQEPLGLLQGLLEQHVDPEDTAATARVLKRLLAPLVVLGLVGLQRELGREEASFESADVHAHELVEVREEL